MSSSLKAGLMGIFLLLSLIARSNCLEDKILKEAYPYKNIIECLGMHYGIKTSELTLLPGGADLNATVYKANTNASSYFVKLMHGLGREAGLTILELLRINGVQQVIGPIKTIQDQFVQVIGDSSLIVFPFIEGKNGFDCHLVDHQWITLGQALKQIHAIAVPPAVQNLIRRETYSPKWREAIRSLYDRIEAGLDGDEIASRLIHFMMDHRTIIFRLVDRAQKFSEEVQRLAPELVLCHSDIHAGNVLIGKNEDIYIVDWDDPILAPKERDLMFIGGGVAGVWNKPDEVKLFYEGYGETTVNTSILAYYRHERILEDIVIYAQELIGNPSRDRNKVIIYNHLASMFEPRNVVEIALETE